MKTKFILHGGFTGEINDLNNSFFREISRDLPEDANILLVYFARRDDEIQKLFEEDKNRILENADNKRLNFICADKNNFIEQIKSAGAVYMRGGDTAKLLDTLQLYPDFRSAIVGKTVAGSSAGAYVLSTYYHSSSQGSIHKGLGIMPLRVACHYKSKDFAERENDDAISLFKQYPENLELVVLKDFEWKRFMY